MKMKKLLASALAAAMVVSSMVGTLVTSAADTVGTITAGTVNAVVGETDTITADINIAFPNGVVAPHNIITIALDGYTLSDVELGEVTYTSATEGKVEIDADGSNLAAGKVLLECPVDSKAPTVTAIALTATFVDADETDTVAGTYAIVVSGDDMTDVNEADIAIDAVNGSLVVAEPVIGPVENAELAKAAYSLRMKISNTFGFQYGFFFNGVNVEYDDIELEVSKPEMNKSTYVLTGGTTTQVFTSADVASGSYPSYGLYYFEYTDIAMFEMSLDVTYTLYTIVDGERAEYYTFPAKSLAAQATDYYTENFSDEVKRAFAVDLLNVGTAAQTHFAAVGAENNALKDFAAPNANVDQQYATDYVVYDEVEGTRDSQITTQLQLLASPSFWYTINLSSAGKTTPADLTFKATYDTLSSGSAKAVTREVNGANLEAKENAYGAYGLYYFGFGDVALYDTNKLITLTITDTEGTTWTHQYSVDSFISKNIEATGTAGDVYRAVASFAQACRNFWPNY